MGVCLVYGPKNNSGLVEKKKREEEEIHNFFLKRISRYRIHPFKKSFISCTVPLLHSSGRGDPSPLSPHAQIHLKYVFHPREFRAFGNK